LAVVEFAEVATLKFKMVIAVVLVLQFIATHEKFIVGEIVFVYGCEDKGHK
jgi:hypothetical protein